MILKGLISVLFSHFGAFPFEDSGEKRYPEIKANK